jgi:ATP-dependent RNA helicase SUPV3L1/SUV3
VYQFCSFLATGTVKRVFKQFKKRPTIAHLAAQNGMNKQFLTRAVAHFTKQVLHEESISREISPIVYNIQTGSGRVDDLWPYFLQFAKQHFPVVGSYDDLRNLSDLTVPSDWFPQAREMKRRVVYHCGPTNSGKTHQALERFRKGKTGLYCGPLRLLAHEVFERTNDMGIPCDLLTGEERRLANSDGETTASHLSCTVEMTPALQPFEVAVLDEIQMLRDQQRGWAWTRVVLGVLVEELHLCGEVSAIDIIERLMEFTGDDLEVKHYERLTPLYCLKDSLHGDMKRLQPGDCLVSFSRGEIFKLRQEVERVTKRSCAVIYGGLPPTTRIQQAQLFNDPKSSCDLLVASDAIGMGLNLNIKRIVFASLTKFDGYRRQSLTPSHAKQIAGRAGRFGSQYPEGEVTTLHRKDLKTLHDLLNAPVDLIEVWLKSDRQTDRQLIHLTICKAYWLISGSWSDAFI